VPPVSWRRRATECGGRISWKMQTLLYHSALGSASPRSPPVSPADGCASLGCHAGRTGTLAPAPSGRAGPGKTVAGTVPRGALHVWPARGSSCRPVTARRSSRREVTRRQKCALFFLSVFRRAGEPRHACNAKGGTRWARLCAGPQPIWRSYTTMASATKLLMETSTCRGNPVIIINMPVPSLVAPSWSGVINTFAYE